MRKLSWCLILLLLAACADAPTAPVAMPVSSATLNAEGRWTIEVYRDGHYLGGCYQIPQVPDITGTAKQAIAYCTAIVGS